MSVPDLSLVLPAYNEERRLSQALDRLSEFAQTSSLSLELIVADDGSSDGTKAVAERWISDKSISNAKVRIITLPHRGKGAAVRRGIAQARGTQVGYCDVDLSAGPEALRSLIEALDTGADVAIASRGMSQSVLHVRQSWLRERAGRFFNWFLRNVTGIPYRDTQCGLKLFKKPAAEQIFRHQRVDGFAFDAEVVLLANRLGLGIREVPIHWSHDPDSKVSYLRDAIAVAKDTMRVIRRLRKGSIHAPGVPSDLALDRMFASENNHWWYLAKRALVMDILKDRTVGRCLDLGCGGGAMLLEAAESNTVFGVDLSVAALQNSKSRGLTNLVLGEVSSLPLASQAFNSVLALDVIEHLPRPDDAMGEACRVLRPDGVLIVTVPAFGWMWSYADHVLGHYRRYSRDQLSEELRLSGFELERLTYFHSWLLPIAWLFRRARSLFRQPESPDDFNLPKTLNALLFKLSSAELRLLRIADLRFGLSLLAVARPAEKPAGSFTTPELNGQASNVLAPLA